MNEPDDFTRRLCRELDRRAEDLPPEVRARLDQARRRAVDQAGRRPLRWAAPLGAAAGLLLALALLRPDTSPPPLALDEPPPAVEDLPLLAGAEDLRFYEDLDLLLWLDAQAPETDGGSPDRPSADGDGSGGTAGPGRG